MEKKLTVRELNEQRKKSMKLDESNMQGITFYESYEEYSNKAQEHDSDLDDFFPVPTEEEIKNWKEKSGR